jgi:4-hydroxy-tetrahydrodipicolinate synthase
MKLEGTFVALVSPFKNNQLNVDKIKELVRFHIDNGTDGIVPCGTTGESPALSEAEKDVMIKTVIQEAAGKVTVVAGTGTNNTEKTIKATQRAREFGADAALVITPYYNKPTQEGLYRHFEAVVKSVDIPIMIYNVPGRTSVNILPETVARLAKFDNIVAIKEASGDLNQVSEVIDRCGDSIKVFSGDDTLFTPILSVGGAGVVSVVANIAPKDLKSLFTAFKTGNMNEVHKWHYQLLPLCNAMFFETNPIPVKTAMNFLGYEVGDLRLPLAPMSDTNRQKLSNSLKEYGLMQ